MAPLSHAFDVPLGPHLEGSQPLATGCGPVSDAAASLPISAEIKPYEERFSAARSGDDGMDSDGDKPRSLFGEAAEGGDLGIVGASQAMLADTQRSLAPGDAPGYVDGSMITGAPDVREMRPSFRTAGGRGVAAAASHDLADAEMGDRTMPSRAVPARARANVLSKPQEGVYTLLPATQAKMGVLLRTLFFVQATSDTSVMAFLGIAHYMMAFSHLIGITASNARVAFFEDLTIAFQEPVALKHFMETDFQGGRRGLYVMGRTACKRHVVGQPSGLREDMLRSHINPGNVKVQWVSRRLSLSLFESTLTCSRGLVLCPAASRRPT